MSQYADQVVQQQANNEFMVDIENRLLRINAALHAMMERFHSRRSVNTSFQITGFEKDIEKKLETLHNFILPGEVSVLTEKRKRVILMYVEEIEILLNIDE